MTVVLKVKKNWIWLLPSSIIRYENVSGVSDLLSHHKFKLNFRVVFWENDRSFFFAQLFLQNCTLRYLILHTFLSHFPLWHCRIRLLFRLWLRYFVILWLKILISLILFSSFDLKGETEFRCYIAPTEFIYAEGVTLKNSPKSAEYFWNPPRKFLMVLKVTGF